MGEFKIGDKVLIDSLYHEGKLGIVAGHLRGTKDMVLVKFVDGSDGHDGRNFTIHDDNGEALDMPKSESLYYFMKKHLKNLGSTL